MQLFSVGSSSWRISLMRGRTHSSHIYAGVWRLSVNGVQFFVGSYALTINWSMALHRVFAKEEPCSNPSS